MELEPKASWLYGPERSTDAEVLRGGPEFAHTPCRMRERRYITPPVLLRTSLVVLGLSLSLCKTGLKTYLAEGRKGSSLPS